MSSEPPTNKDTPSFPESPISDADKKPSCLKLVHSNSFPAQPPSHLPFSSAGFTAEIHSKGPHLYEMKIHDSFLDVACALILQIAKREGEVVALCHFPAILDEESRLLDEDETLYGMLMVLFQIKVLDQLFLFCTSNKASQLFIYMDDDQAEGFGVYHDFLERQDETLTADGEKTEMVIPVNRKAIARFRKFMKKTTITFEKDLWREQRFNPVIREYLKSHVNKRSVTQETQPPLTEGDLPSLS